MCPSPRAVELEMDCRCRDLERSFAERQRAGEGDGGQGSVLGAIVCACGHLSRAVVATVGIRRRQTSNRPVA
jgi:hypothetical protein